MLLYSGKWDWLFGSSISWRYRFHKGIGLNMLDFLIVHIRVFKEMS